MSAGMATNPWSVTNTKLDISIGPNTPIPVGVKIVSSLDAAMTGPEASTWAFEVGGEPVATLAEFRKLYAEAPTAEPGEFVARSGNLLVESV